MKLICMGEEYPCVWAEKDEAAGTVTAYGEAGNVVVRAVKVSDFSDYIIKDGHWYTMPLNEIKTDKEAELSAACKAAITAGMDVETSQGTGALRASGDGSDQPDNGSICRASRCHRVPLPCRRGTLPDVHGRGNPGYCHRQHQAQAVSHHTLQPSADVGPTHRGF